MRYNIEKSIIKEKLKNFENVQLSKYLYRNCYINNWKKGDQNGKIIHDRDYIVVKTFKNGAIQSESSYGYYDNLKNEYVVGENRYRKEKDLMEA